MVNIVFHLPNILLHPPPLPSVLRIDNAVPLFDARLLHLVILCVCAGAKTKRTLKSPLLFMHNIEIKIMARFFAALSLKNDMCLLLYKSAVSGNRQSIFVTLYWVLDTVLGNRCPELAVSLSFQRLKGSSSEHCLILLNILFDMVVALVAFTFAFVGAFCLLLVCLFFPLFPCFCLLTFPNNFAGQNFCLLPFNKNSLAEMLAMRNYRWK